MSSILKKFLETPEFTNSNACKFMEYKSGSRIMLEGEESLDVYYILEGHVRINKRVVLHDGRHIQSGFSELAPGDTFGELNLFDGSPRSASVVASDDVKLVRLNRDVLIDYLDAHPKEAYHLFKEWLQRLARDLRKSNERSSSLFAWGLNQHEIDDQLQLIIFPGILIFPQHFPSLWHLPAAI
ncbi:MAG: cyclic nucleotide-binding domain-containing protein [Gammaproteobacteria bacterium]|nr:cyclic nucleotide-binding domain-containing protein [Gammaproteobacteria bacterium]